MAKSTKQIPIPQAAGACTAFAAFSVSILVGISSENPVDTVLSRALLALLLGFAVGFLVGLVCDWIVREEIGRVEVLMSADSAASVAAEVDLDEEGGVDVVDELPDPLDEASAQSETRVAVGNRREKNEV